MNLFLLLYSIREFLQNERKTNTQELDATNNLAARRAVEDSVVTRSFQFLFKLN